MTPGRIFESLDVIELIRSGLVPRLIERLLRVNRVTLTARRSLPVLPD
jgi:hypothetical protein